MNNDAILLLSGGLDSTSVLFQLVRAGHRPLCLTFDYGQTLQREIEFARANAARAGMEWIGARADMSWLAPHCALFTGSMPAERTREQIAHAGTPPTYVPFRNGIMLAYAAALGEARGIHLLVCGGNGLESGNYWDDTQEFGVAMQNAIRAGTSPEYQPIVYFPNAHKSKAAVVRAGVAAGMDVGATWSCYHNAAAHCGVCDSCVQRAAALTEAA